MKSRPRGPESAVRLAPHTFALLCALIAATGAGISTGVFLIVTTERGASYAESFRLLSMLHRELTWRAAIIYASSLVVIVLGVSLLSLLYSHRVAGPLHKLGLVARTVASGNLLEQAKLRRRDAVHPLADSMNELIRTCRMRVAHLEMMNTTLQKILENPKSPSSPRETGRTIEGLKKTTDIMKNILEHVKL